MRLRVRCGASSLRYASGRIGPTPRRSLNRGLPLCLLATFLLAPPVHAQIVTSRASNWSFGAQLDVSIPRGEFDRHTKQGFGLSGHAIRALDGAGGLGLRADVGYLNYGYTRDTYPCGTFCRYEATTTNNIGILIAGPQFFLPTARFTPYVHASYGLLWFGTSSEVTNEGGSPSPFRHDVSANDVTGSYVLGGGFYVPMGGRWGGMVWHVGARFYGGGEADYLTGDSVQRDGSGNYTVTPRHSRTEFWVYHVGVSSSTGR